MGSVFAIQVRTGLETKAKEMLKHVLIKTNETMVKAIYALETHTEFINGNSEVVNVNAITENDISEHLTKESYRSAISNKRKQLEAIERYDTPKYNEMKNLYEKEINILESKLTQLKSTTKSLHSVLSGYLLIELEQNSTYLPNRLWHLIKSVPLVSKILSTDPIPEEEMEQFISNLDEVLVPQVEISFEKEVDFEEVNKMQCKVLEEVNQKGISKEEEEALIDKIDNIKLSVVEKVKKIIESKPENPLFNKIKAFIKRKREVVSMPLRLLENLYTDNELQFIGKTINGKDFLYRLSNLSNRKMVQEE